MYLKALDGKRRVLGGEHPSTCRTLSTLATMYTNQRRYTEAESAALAAYQGYVQRMGADGEDTRQVVEQLAAQDGPP